jgi:hypothetical protein
MWTSQEVAALQNDGTWQAAVSYNLTASASNVNEGSFVTATLTTTGLANGTVIPYVITGANILANDFTIGNITGNFVIQNGSNTISFTSNADITLEGAETFTITAGPVSANIIINDTSVPIDPYFANTVLLLHGNGTNNSQNNTFLDSSTNNFTITRNGNSTQGTFSPYGSNWSAYFSGSDSLQTNTNSLATILGTAYLDTTTIVTIEFWAYQTQRNGINFIIGEMAPTGGTNNWSFSINASGYPEFFWWTGGTNYATGGTVIPLNTWTHFAVVVNASNIKIFVNGIQETLTGTTTLTNISRGDIPYIAVGKFNNGGAGYAYYGYLSNLRIVKSALYSGNFTPSRIPLTAITNTSLLFLQTNRFKDNSVNNFTLTSTGTPAVQRFSPFSPSVAYSTSTIGGSVYFDGTGDYIKTNTTTAFGASDYTIECWVYHIGTPNPCWLWDGLTDSGTGPQIFTTSSGTTLNFYKDSSTQIINASVTLKLNQWTHYAFCRVGTTTTAYINGVSVGSGTDNTNSTTPIRGGFGSRSRDGAEPNQAYFGDFRIVVGTAVYTSNFTPPTAPLTAITNTVLLTNFTNAGIIDNTMQNNLETIADAKISTTQSKFGGTSMYFDGNGDYLISPYSENYQLGTGNFTIEFWINASASGSYNQVIGTHVDLEAGSWRVGNRFNNANQVYFARGTGGGVNEFTASVNVNDGSWHHVAVVRNSGTVTIYVDGTSSASASITGTCSSSNQMRIGYNQRDNSYVTGYIDDLRITKGYARYTSNFTPPTLEFYDN